MKGISTTTVLWCHCWLLLFILFILKKKNINDVNAYIINTNVPMW